MPQCVVVCDFEVLDAMQEQVHAADGGGELVDFLPVRTDVAPLLSVLFEVCDGGD